MAFSPPVVGCLLKKAYKRGGGHGHPRTPLATPLVSAPSGKMRDPGNEVAFVRHQTLYKATVNEHTHFTVQLFPFQDLQLYLLKKVFRVKSEFKPSGPSGESRLSLFLYHEVTTRFWHYFTK